MDYKSIRSSSKQTEGIRTMAERDPEMVKKIQARARADREIVDRYNANLLREQGIEPNETLLQAMCGQNIAAAFEAEAKLKKAQQS